MNIGQKNWFKWRKGKERRKIYNLILYFKQNSLIGTDENTESFRRDSFSHLRF
jgi:hypothetical protein